MMLAKLVGVRSTCNSRKVGAIVVRNNRILATGYNGAVHGAPHCIDRGPDFCLRRTIGAHDGEKYNYCISSHAEVNALNQAARFGIPLEGASLYCTLEPCNWCFKQLIQAGIKEIYYEESYASENKEFDLYWRRMMESSESIKVFRQIRVSPEALEMVIRWLQSSSTRVLQPTSPEDPGDLNADSLLRILGGENDSKEPQDHGDI